MKKLLALAILFSSLSAAQVQTKVLATGTIYPWKIIEAIYPERNVLYFTWEFVNSNYGTRNSNGNPFGYINYLYREDLQNLTDMLRVFGTLPTNYPVCYSGAGYSFTTKKSDNYIYIEDWKYSAIKISKTKARNMATEIELILQVLPPDPNKR